MEFCNCDQKLLKDDRFCPSCGVKVNKQIDSLSEVYSIMDFFRWIADNPTKAINLSFLLILLAVVSFVIGVIFPGRIDNILFFSAAIILILGAGGIITILWIISIQRIK